MLAPLILIASEWLPALVMAQEDSMPADEAQTAEGLLVRPTLTGDWGGYREKLGDRGVSVDADLTYTFQWVAGGGLDGAVFDQFSDEEDTGNTVSMNLNLELDTAAAGFWQGGFFNFRLEGRAGRSVLQRAGSVSAVDNDALFPNEVDQFDEETVAITELTFTQYFGDHVAVYAGLLDTGEGDENEIAGSALSNAHFLNSALLYSLVEDATVPNVSLGGGVLFEPSETLYGSFSVFGTQETAGEDPFEHTQGTTFSTEWTLAHTVRSRSGAQTLGLLYGIDASRVAIATDPRRMLAAVLLGLPIPDTNDDTWAIYYNAHQYIHGDAEGGWGAFVRFGTSDGDPNPVEWTVAAGLGGVGGVLERPNDSWGIGAFYLGLSDEDLLEGLNVEEEVGGELFYNVAITPWLHVTPDVQVIDSALPRSDTAWVLSLRTHVEL
ncbi:MAG TPA: carbohydrate porin [Candidatus Binatia bacterium]|nr:carbohydrate porin [Candidatus Binatia bacterium]